MGPQSARPDQAVPRRAVDGQRGPGEPPLRRAWPPVGFARSGPMRGRGAGTGTDPRSDRRRHPLPHRRERRRARFHVRAGRTLCRAQRDLPPWRRRAGLWPQRPAAQRGHRRRFDPWRRVRAGRRCAEHPARAQARPAPAGLPGQGLLAHGRASRLEQGTTPADRRRRPQGRLHAPGRPGPRRRDGRVRRLGHQPQCHARPDARGRLAGRAARTAAGAGHDAVLGGPAAA